MFSQRVRNRLRGAQEITRQVPVWETQMRERRFTVLRPVQETSMREERFTVQRPVTETIMRDTSYNVVRNVVETSEREERFVVQRPVTETSMREERFVVQRPVTETVMQPRCQTVMRPVTQCQTRYVDQGCWGEPGGVRAGRVRRGQALAGQPATQVCDPRTGIAQTFRAAWFGRGRRVTRRRSKWCSACGGRTWWLSNFRP